MGDVPITHRQFLDALNEIADSQATAQEWTSNLRRALLDFGSETPDNLNCADRVEVGVVGLKTGPKIRSRDVLFRELAHTLEDEPMPAALKEHFPGMSEKYWDAFTRLTTLIHLLLRPDGSQKR